MRVRILKPIAEFNEKLGRFFEHKIGEEIELKQERAKALEKAGLVKCIGKDLKKDSKKDLEKPPMDKMIYRPFKRK